MIELTEQQVRALEDPGVTPPRVVRFWANETFVLLRLAEYERAAGQAYDDSPWTKAELQTLAWEAAEGTSWDEYDATEES